MSVENWKMVILDGEVYAISLPDSLSAVVRLGPNGQPELHLGPEDPAEPEYGVVPVAVVLTLAGLAPADAMPGQPATLVNTDELDELELAAAVPGGLEALAEDDDASE